jgi:DNA-binding transcriptional ArsR family regulator
MGLSKTSAFSTNQNQLAALAKALAHPARIAILEVLLKRQSCVCGEIVEELPLSQATVSQHLKELKTVGLIQGDIEGTRICYCIHPEGWRKLQQVLGQWLVQAESNCCS